jgi:hypothetical protein
MDRRVKPGGDEVCGIVGKTRARKTAPRERMVMTGQTAADADAERYVAR